MSNLKQLATEYFKIFSNKDLTGLSDIFADNIKICDWERSAEGKVASLASNKQFIFDDVDTVKVTPLSLYEENNTVVAEIEVLVNSKIKLSVVDVIKFEDNKIVSIRAYKG